MVGSIGVYVKPSNATGEMRYFLKDHLGSVQVVLSSGAVVLERLSYEPFGQRRNTNGSPNPGQTIVGVKTDRGYTGHEHLDESGLIHMNGRIFDPVMARFMSADPFVQAAGNLQSYNRYSYVLNNPLGYTHPSGFFFRQIREAIGNLLDRPSAHTWHAAIHSRPGLQLADGLARRYPQETQIVGTVVLGVVSWYCGGCLSTTAGAFWAAIGNAAGAAGTTYAQGGDPSDYWRAGLTSLGTSAAFSVVGNVTIGQDRIVQIGAHALVGCASAAAGGGECGAGAAGAAAAKGITLGASELGIKSAEGQYVVAAVAGGTASQLAGGRFANGALTAAFGYLLNYCMTVGCAFSRTMGWIELGVQSFFNGLYPRASAGVGYQWALMAGPGGFQMEEALLGDTAGNTCSVQTSCLLIGLGLGGQHGPTAQLQSGTLRPDSTGQIGLFGTAALGSGLKLDPFSIGRDGNVQASGGPSYGAFLGVGVKVCTQTVRECK